MGKNTATDPAMLRAREAFKASELTLEQLGERMGYEPKMARISAWQFLNKTSDPRLSMLRRFAEAVGVKVEELVAERMREPKRGGKMQNKMRL
jgi:transcriptional regulator with XRE-family HTH domain